MKGKFIVIEGMDGTGKTTIAKELASRLSWRYDKEPKGQVRENIMSLQCDNPDDAMTFRTIMFAYDRYLHCLELEDLLNDGHNIICDRYLPSNLAYQGWDKEGREFVLKCQPPNLIKPDLIFFLQSGYDTSCQRLRDRSENVNALDVTQRTEYNIVATAYESAFKLLDAIWKPKVPVIRYQNGLTTSLDQLIGNIHNDILRHVDVRN